MSQKIIGMRKKFWKESDFDFCEKLHWLVLMRKKFKANFRKYYKKFWLHFEKIAEICEKLSEIFEKISRKF